MNRIDRMVGIILALQTQPRTAQQLADRFEVSRRTVLRDIDALSQLLVPITAISGPNGGYSLPPDYSQPPIHLTTDEATVVLLALSGLGLPVESPLGSAHRIAREKILAVLNREVKSQALANLQHLTVHTDTEDVVPELITQLRDAAATGEWIEIDHANLGTSTTRVILPELVYLADGRWYVRSIDKLRSARRTFRIGRITACRYAIPPNDAAKIVRTAQLTDGTYGQPSNPEIIVRLTARGCEFANDHPDFRDRVGSLDDRAILRFRCPTSELPYYARELLRFGTEVIVESPPDLLALMTESLVKSLKHHQNQ